MSAEQKNEETIFYAALELKSQAEREAYIKEACGDDTDLLERIQSLLKAHDAEDRFLESPEVPSVDPNATLDTSPLIEGPGTIIDRYELLELIGEGGMGLVYLAEQKEPVRRKVVLKIVKPGMDSKQVIARFEAERQALAVLDHPNIAHVFDAGATTAGRPYFVMEYVKGMSITRYCDDKKLGIEQRLRLFEQVCEGVHHAHQKGIIHRDLKPSNILVSVHGDRSVPKIIDFGIAKAITQPLTDKTFVTFQGQLLGTPEYMSPEQVDLATQDIDTRSDIYSLGVVLYELLAGVLPFEEGSLARAGFTEIQRTIRESEPASPSIRLTSLGEKAKTIAASRGTQVIPLVRRLHRELEWIPLKAMRKDRCRRYKSTAEMADDIHNYLTGRPLIAGPETAIYRVQKFVRKHAGSVATVALLALAIVLGLIVSMLMYFEAEDARRQEAYLRNRAEKAETIARNERHRAEDEAVRANEQAETLRRTLYFNSIALAQANQKKGAIRAAGRLLRSCPADLRDWEWYHLWHLSNGAQQTLYGHKSQITSISLDSDASRIASASKDGTVKVWDLRTGANTLTLRGHRGSVTKVRFSPDGRQIASSGTDRMILFWDAANGAQIRALKHESHIECMEFNKEGSSLLSAGGDGKVRLWDVKTGAHTTVINGDSNGVDSVALSRGGELVALRRSGRREPIRIWDVQSRTKVVEMDPNEHIFTLAFSPDGTYLAGKAWKKVILWEATTGVQKGTLSAQSSPTCFEFSLDNKFLVSGHADGSVLIWDLGRGEPIATLLGHQWEVSSVAFAPDTTRIISAGLDGTLRVWDPNREFGVRTLTGHSDSVRSVAFNANGEQVVSASDDGNVMMWDVQKGEALKTLRTHNNHFARFSSDGTHLVNHNNNEIKVWNLTSDSTIAAFPHRIRNMSDVTLSSGGEYVASGTAGASDGVQIWDSRTGALIKTLDAQVGFSRTVFSPDGQQLATFGWGASITIWDAKSFEKLRILVADVAGSAWVPDVAYDSRGDRLVSLGRGMGVMTMWNARTGAQIFQVSVKDVEPTVVTFNPSGTRIITAGKDIRLWNAETGTEIMQLEDHEASIRSAVFSPDGRYLVTAGDGKLLKIWDTSEPNPIHILETEKKQGSQDHRMIAWWTFDEKGGRIVSDSSGNNLHGRLMGNPERVPGRMGGALRFDGEGDYVDCGDDPAFDLIAPFTIAVWLMVGSLESHEEPIVFGYQANPIICKGDGAWQIQVFRAGNPKFSLSDVNWKPSLHLFGRATVNDGHWHHVAGVWDGKEIRLFVDSVLDSAQLVDLVDQPDIRGEPVLIGADVVYEGQRWKGLIDDVRIYSYALSPEEVKMLYEGKEPPR